MKLKQKIIASLVGGLSLLGTVAIYAPKALGLANTPYFTGAFACSRVGTQYEAYLAVGPTFPLGTVSALRWRASWIGTEGFDISREALVSPPVVLPGLAFADVLLTNFTAPESAFLEYGFVTGIGSTINRFGIPVFYPVTDSPLYMVDFAEFADGTTSDEVESLCPSPPGGWPAVPKDNPIGYNKTIN